MFILGLLLSVFVFADYNQNKADILNLTGLSESEIVRQTEKDLESLLVCSEDGFSSGLEEFYVDGYMTPSESLNTTTFTVVTEVTGPSSVSCYVTDTYMCYTYWTQKSGEWSVLGTECDYDEVAGE